MVRSPMPVMRCSALVLAMINSVSAIVGPGSLGTDLSILTHNDLYGALRFHNSSRNFFSVVDANFGVLATGGQSFRSESLIVLNTWKSYANASSTCASLGESLWSPSQADFLPYLSYEGKAGLYWVANDQCANISDTGLSGVTSGCQGDTQLCVRILLR